VIDNVSNGVSLVPMPILPTLPTSNMRKSVAARVDAVPNPCTLEPVAFAWLVRFPCTVLAAPATSAPISAGDTASAPVVPCCAACVAGAAPMSVVVSTTTPTLPFTESTAPPPPVCGTHDLTPPVVEVSTYPVVAGTPRSASAPTSAAVVLCGLPVVVLWL